MSSCFTRSIRDNPGSSFGIKISPSCEGLVCVTSNAIVKSKMIFQNRAVLRGFRRAHRRSGNYVKPARHARRPILENCIAEKATNPKTNCFRVCAKRRASRQLFYFANATKPGSSFPSTNSILAPPPVDTCEKPLWLILPFLSTFTLSPPPIMEMAPCLVASIIA